MTSFAVKNFEVACSDGVAGTLKIAKLSGKIKVSSSGAFKARDDNGVTVFKVKGQINRNKSTGTFRYYGAIDAPARRRRRSRGRRPRCARGRHRGPD